MSDECLSIVENVVIRSVSRRYSLQQTINATVKALKHAKCCYDSRSLPMQVELEYCKYITSIVWEDK